MNNNLIGGKKEIDITNLGDEPAINSENNRMDVYKLRLIYKFIEINKNLSNLSITKNPIRYKSIISTDIDMDNVTKFIQKDEKNHYIINCFYSFILKIMTELLKNNEVKINRGHFNLKFDIDEKMNIDSENFDYKKKYIMFN